MEIDSDRIDETVLALLFLGRHDGVRTWKSFDWSAMERLHSKGLISDPVGKAKSVAFTEQGLLQSEVLFRKLFEKRSADGVKSVRVIGVDRHARDAAECPLCSQLLPNWRVVPPGRGTPA
jgi:hypothetical protein